MNDIVAMLITPFLDVCSWNSVLVCCKEWNFWFGHELERIRKKYENVQIFVKGLTGKNVIVHASLFEKVSEFKLRFLQKEHPEWEGKEGATNLMIWYRFNNSGKDFDNCRRLFWHVGLRNNFTVHAIGCFGARAEPMKHNINWNDPKSKALSFCRETRCHDTFMDKYLGKNHPRCDRCKDVKKPGWITWFPCLHEKWCETCFEYKGQNHYQCQFCQTRSEYNNTVFMNNFKYFT